MTSQEKVGIAAIFKNEAPYIIEWLAHHRLMGVGRFFIADNGSSDGTTELLAALQRCNLVDFISFPPQPGIKSQIPAYQELLKRFGQEVRWMGFIDADEFLWPTTECNSFAAFLDAAEAARPSIGALILNWACYGSSKQARYSKDPVTARFTWRARKDHPLNHNQKWFTRTQAFASFEDLHQCRLLPEFEHYHTNLELFVKKLDANYTMSNTVVWDGFRLNHYVIKSYEEYFFKKSPRGHANSNHPLDRIFFMDRDENEQSDVPHSNHLEKVAREIEYITTSLEQTGYKQIPDELQNAGGRINQTQAIRLPIVGQIDQWSVKNEAINVSGWALAWKQDPIAAVEFNISGRWIPCSSFRTQPRPDVLNHYPQAVVDCGFAAELTIRETLSNHAIIRCRAITRDGIITETLSEHAITQ